MGASVSISLRELREVAEAYGVPVSHLKAVIAVESNGRGFNRDGTPVILFEPHKFNKYTNGLFQRTHPHLTSTSYAENLRRKLYGGNQHKKLREAVLLDREAALKSCSWGMFQIMGFNYKACGFATLQEFINAMFRSEATQLVVAMRFIKRGGMLDALRSGDWHSFARRYNGAAYERRGYHTKLASHAAKHAHLDVFS